MYLLKLKKGFTLAELISVLVILGIVAAITVPTALNRTLERQNKTKLRKALTTYQTAIEKMVIENDLKGGLNVVNSFATSNNCTNIRKYIKGIDGNGCIFRTHDGLWWDMGGTEGYSVARTMVSFKREDLTSSEAMSDDYKAFIFITSVDDNNSIRVNDVHYEIGRSGEAPTEKVITYLQGEIYSSNTSCFCSGEGCCSSSCKNKLCKEVVKKCDTRYVGSGAYNYFGNVSYSNSCQRNRFYDENGNYIGVIEEFDNGNGMYTDQPTLSNMTYPTFYKVSGSGDNATIAFAINCGGNSICDAVYNKKGELIKAHSPYKGNCNSASECANRFPNCTMQLCTYNTSTGEWNNPDPNSNYTKLWDTVLKDFLEDGGSLYEHEE